MKNKSRYTHFNIIAHMKCLKPWYHSKFVKIIPYLLVVSTQMTEITVGERTVAVKIIARCSITQTPPGQWNIDNVAD